MGKLNQSYYEKFSKRLVDEERYRYMKKLENKGATKEEWDIFEDFFSCGVCNNQIKDNAINIEITDLEDGHFTRALVCDEKCFEKVKRILDNLGIEIKEENNLYNQLR